MIKVGAIDLDADANKSLGGTYGIKGFPTIKFFGFNKNKAQDYNGARDANGIVQFAVGKVSSEVNSRGSGGKGGGSKGG